MRRLLQSPRSWACVTIAVGFAGLAVTAWAAPTFEYRGLAVHASAWWAAAFWTAGAAQWLWLSRDRWRVGDPWFDLARWTWALGLLLLAVHVAVTFELVHGWSHAAAFEHTRQASGVGEGIFVNYLVLIVWAIDVLWALARPGSYLRRPSWAGWVVHSFLAFIVFNSTVVYGTGLMRWGAAVWFALLALYLVRRVASGRPT